MHYECILEKMYQYSKSDDPQAPPANWSSSDFDEKDKKSSPSEAVNEVGGQA